MKLLIPILASILVLFFTSCRPKEEIVDDRNTVEITTHPITKDDEEWTEVTIEQKLSRKSPLLVQGLRNGIADTMQYGSNSYSEHVDSKGRRVWKWTFHARPIKPNQEVILRQRDFIFTPTVDGWPLVYITSKPTKSP